MPGKVNVAPSSVRPAIRSVKLKNRATLEGQKQIKKLKQIKSFKNDVRTLK